MLSLCCRVTPAQEGPEEPSWAFLPFPTTRGHSHSPWGTQHGWDIPPRTGE